MAAQRPAIVQLALLSIVGAIIAAYPLSGIQHTRYVIQGPQLFIENLAALLLFVMLALAWIGQRWPFILGAIIGLGGAILKVVEAIGYLSGFAEISGYYALVTAAALSAMAILNFLAYGATGRQVS